MIGVATIATAGLTIPANAAPDGSAVVINEVYGGGGNSGAYYTHDFVELYNPTSAPIAVAGFQIKYSGANGNLGNTTTLPADATIQPGSYYLVQMAKGSGGTAPLPAPDFTGGAAMAGANGIVELTDGTTIIDTVGYGSTATRFETAPTAPLSNSTSAGRTVPGVDTDNNAADFTVGAPTPTNSANNAVEPTAVTPAAATSADMCGTAHDTYTIPGTAGVVYSVDGTVTSAGTYPGTGTVVVTAAPAEGYVVTEGADTSWSLVFTDVACDPNTPTAVTPADATFADMCETANDTYTIPATAGVVYSVDGTVTSAGTYPGTGTVVITAAAAEGYVLADGAPSTWTATFTDEACTITWTPIAQIQGTGTTTPLLNQTVTTRGIVTAMYPEGGLRGFYIQTPGIPDLADGASDGVFVYTNTKSLAALSIGTYAEVTGTAAEFNGLTQLNASGTAASFTVLAETVEPVVAIEVEFPATDEEREALEGMLVMPVGTFTISDNYDTNTFGTVTLAYGETPLVQPGELHNPVTDRAAFDAVAADNAARAVVVDDGQTLNYTTFSQNNDDIPLPYVTIDGALRAGAHVTFGAGVIMDYRYNAWTFQPTQPLRDGSSGPLVFGANTRTAVPAAVGGDISIASFNVLNYFATLGQTESGCSFYPDRDGKPTTSRNCTVRGAYDQDSFLQQQEKIVAAINSLDASVVALEEIEASSEVGHSDRDFALASLVSALNAAGTAKWDYVSSPSALPSSEDVIRTAYIYQPDEVSPVGDSVIFQHSAFSNARLPLAQEWRAIDPATNAWGGQSFVTVVNHFKSKGSGVNDGTGQGNANPDRVAQATALSNWVDVQYAGQPVFLMGDFNAYSAEDPMQVFYGAGFTSIGTAYNTAETYVFDGLVGSLDHVLANEEALAMVSGATVWSINSVESIALEYSRANYNVTQFHSADPYRSSDHDPMKVGLNIVFDVEEEPIPGDTVKSSVGFTGTGSATAVPVVVSVYDTSGALVQRSIGVATRDFAFTGLAPGTYTVKFTTYRPYIIVGNAVQTVTIGDVGAAVDIQIARR